jgi:hypothetical protein
LLTRPPSRATIGIRAVTDSNAPYRRDFVRGMIAIMWGSRGAQ